MTSSCPSTYSTSRTSKVSLLHLAAASIAATIVAAEPIRALSYHYRRKQQQFEDDDKNNDENVETDNHIKDIDGNIRVKLDGTLVTDADLIAQSCIVRILRKVEGDFVIVGEEEGCSGEYGDGDDPVDALHKKYVSNFSRELEDNESDRIFRLAQEEVLHRYFGGGRCSLAEGVMPNPILDDEIYSNLNEDDDTIFVDPSRVRVFVDPLDGTKSYANGDYDIVTILVAIVLDGSPHFGVITKPFGYKGHASVLSTPCVTLYGGPLLNSVYFAGAGPATSPSSLLPRRAVISASRSGGVVRTVVDQLAEGTSNNFLAEPLEVSGAGEKSLRLIVGTEQECLWFFPMPGTSRWDVAASDALLRAMGGKLTDKYGKELDYLKDRDESENMDGIIASNDAELHEECIRLFNEGKWERDKNLA
jgi:3'-phosphoadenosine 5'-phosphosulfate (PAPS) 3'-phosphatase